MRLFEAGVHFFFNELAPVSLCDAFADGPAKAGFFVKQKEHNPSYYVLRNSPPSNYLSLWTLRLAISDAVIYGRHCGRRRDGLGIVTPGRQLSFGALLMIGSAAVVVTSGRGASEHGDNWSVDKVGDCGKGSGTRLAVYGTLAPGRVNHHQISALRGSWRRGTVRGRLFSSGWGAALGFPGLILDALGELVEVEVFESAELPEHWARLDKFEGSGYRRVVTTVGTADGPVGACIYVLAEEQQ